MSHRTLSLAPTIVAVAFAMTPIGGGLAASPAHGTAVATPPAAAAVTGPLAYTTSLNPVVTIRNATPAQTRRLATALDRFRVTGLALPDLQVVFSADPAACRGHFGLFDPKPEPWRISICSDLDAVYEHELAHAWAAATLEAERRDDFMELRGYEVWSDNDVAWNKRGVEGAALIIQQGLGGLPLPPALSDETLSRLAAFQLLTGLPDPRLTQWEIDHRSAIRGDTGA